MISFLLMINRQCKTRFSRYYTQDLDDPVRFESRLSQECISRPSNHCLFFSFEGYHVVYRPYGNLLLIVGSDSPQNEFAWLEWLQLLMETMNQYFDNVTEMDIVFQLEKVHMIVDELLPKGILGETNSGRVLKLLGNQ
ncbi:putative AP-4 complex subunit sigma-1 [Hesseltinella vesiculosa]|uniref:AP complex subunit sigma n=1 Tax=Hesseltinella vesiculosa TaxID=101127 RepID=A0A1X2GIJ8_9FUNG|nr:putative AP-4 complex subunit sigma-1 [Hesseltinella vesiculosa]